MNHNWFKFEEDDYGNKIIQTDDVKMALTANELKEADMKGIDKLYGDQANKTNKK